MNTITNASAPLKLFGAVLALAALIVAALALAAGVGAQAGTPGTAGNTYADPQPCGPGANTAFQPEPHEVTTGHFYLFDTYWQNTTATQSSNGNTGVLRTNTCPPKLTTTTETDGEDTTTTTTLTDSGIDVDEAIFHVLDKHKTTIVAGASGDPNRDKLRLDHYPEVDDTDTVDAGDQVWWLRLEDPNLTGDQTSDLTLGFSTKRFDEKYWARDNDQPAFRYMFEVERNPGIAPSAHPHLLAYKKRGADVGGTVARAELVWDSAKVHVKALTMEPGQLEDLQWVFTKPGTYAISVHLLGFVRQSNPKATTETGYDANWKRISPNDTETSEVKRYVIQVGAPLDEEEPPVFGVNLNVPENSAAGTALGDPIPVYRTESATLEYSLTGEDSDQFTTEALTEPHRVRIKVADGADLDFETKPAYDLTLGVSNKKDHEGNADDVIDDALAVRIDLENVDEGPRLALSATNTNPHIGNVITIRAVMHDAPSGSTPVLTWYWKDDGIHSTWSTVIGEDLNPHHGHEVITSRDNPANVSYKVKMAWGTSSVWSSELTVHWRAQFTGVSQ